MPGLPFDPNLLSTFLAVLDAGRISAAAKALRLSQPAVTAQIRKLEEGLGTALFVRSARGVVPTDAGLRLAQFARSMYRLLDDAVAAVSSGEERLGPLVIAASTTAAAHLLPPLLAEFRSAHRGVPLRVLVDNTEGVVEAVRAGRVPLGLVEGHTRAPGVRLEPYVDDELVPIVGRGAPFTLRRARDLEGVPLLWREAGSGTRAVIERALRRARLNRRQVRALDVELGSTEAVIGAAAAGLGVAFVSRWSVRAHLAAGLVHIVHLAAGLVHIVPGLDLIVRRTFCWTLPTGGLGGTARHFYESACRQPPG